MYGYFIFERLVTSLPIYVYMLIVQLIPTDGVIRKNAHLRTGRYHQVCMNNLMYLQYMYIDSLHVVILVV